MASKEVARQKNIKVGPYCNTFHGLPRLVQLGLTRVKRSMLMHMYTTFPNRNQELTNMRGMKKNVSTEQRKTKKIIKKIKKNKHHVLDI